MDKKRERVGEREREPLRYVSSYDRHLCATRPLNDAATNDGEVNGVHYYFRLTRSATAENY